MQVGSEEYLTIVSYIYKKISIKISLLFCVYILYKFRELIYVLYLG